MSKTKPAGKRHPNSKAAEAVRDPSWMERTLARIPERRDFWIIFAAALLVRLIYVACAWAANPAFDVALRGFDQFNFQTQAGYILGGDWLLRKVGLFYYSPIYSYYCALVYRVFGVNNFWALHLLQTVTGALTCAVGFSLARTWLGRPAALLAGLFFMLLAPWLFYEQELIHEGFMQLFYIVMLWGLRTAQVGRRWGAARLALAGVFGMLAMIGRGNAGMILAALVPWIVLATPPAMWPGRLARDSDHGRDARATRRFNLAGAAAFAFGVALILLPLVARNYAVDHHLTLGMGNGKVMFYIGNNAGARGDFSYSERFLDAFNKKDADPKIFMKYFMEDLRTAPGAIITNLLRKTYFFFAARDLPDNLNFQLGRHLIAPAGWSPVQWEWIVPLGLVGLGITLAQRRREWSLLWLFTAVFTVSLVLIVPIGRYRQPILISLVIFAALAIEWAAQSWRERKYERLAGAGLAFVLLAGALWPWQGTYIRDNDYMAAIAMAMQRQKLDLAQRVLDEAKAAYPGSNAFLSKDFELAAARGDHYKARQIGEFLLQNPPFDPEVALALCDLDIQEGKNLERARSWLGELAKSDFQDTSGLKARAADLLQKIK